MIQLKEVIHLYLGCEVLLGDRNWKSSNISEYDRVPYTDPEYGKPVRTKLSLHLMENFASMQGTLMLRPLSDMTHEELQECGNMIYDFSDEPELNNHKWQDFTSMICSEQFVWLLKRGFDLFDLIKSKQAIDKTKERGIH